MAVDKKNKQEIKRIINDPLLFCAKTLKIQDKYGALIPFCFNQAQKRLYGEIMRQKQAGQPVRIIILKARQMGFSTAVAALFYHATVTRANVNSMVVAHKADASANIFSKTKLFYEESPPFLRPLKKAANSRELIFENPSSKERERAIRPGLRSKITIETALNKEAGRSATIHNLHISELAFWPYPTETMTSLLQAVPFHKDTMVIIESTANGLGGAFYEQWQRALSGESVFVPMFFPWYENPEYQLAAAPDFCPDREERELAQLYGLTDRQLLWRRWCVTANCGGDQDVFRQEYPTFAQEAFIASGRPVFDSKALAAALTRTAEPVFVGYLREEQGRVVLSPQAGGYLRIWRQPEEGKEYVIGIDTAAGKEGGDYAVMEVLERGSMEQAAEWHGHIDPDLLGEQAAWLGRYYQLARLVPEVNNHGIATVNALKRLGYPRVYRRRTVNRYSDRTMQEYGFLTSRRTKPLLISALAEYVREDAARLRSREAIQECLTYFYEESGAANAREGCHDDRVMALALAVYAMTEQPYYQPDEDADVLWAELEADEVTGY